MKRTESSSFASAEVLKWEPPLKQLPDSERVVGQPEAIQKRACSR